jgi:enoyl-CoA hydratase/carnithine racemase
MDVMIKSMRQSTLETLGLGSVLEIFRNGRLPADAGSLVDEVFGESASRGSLVVSGANGIVGAGKTMQLGSRLAPYGVRVVCLDFPDAPDGIGKQYPGLVRAFGRDGASRIMGNIIRLTYDGKHLPPELVGMRPRYLLEAIPEILEVKRAHYALFREAVPGIEIRSVTSGFPSTELGVGIAHPAFPHEINKVWEVVEDKPSAITRLKWALGLMPIPVADRWSFVLDVLFCGLTLAGTRYHQATNMPFWKIDKYIRQLLGPNPFRAHDAIGALGANFLTWSCLHHLSGMYGAVFEPTPTLEEHKVAGNWYPPNHFRPLVDWKLERGEAEDDFRAWTAWYPDVFKRMEEADWQQLHVNAEHDGTTGVITIGRDSYNGDVDAELNRAIDWLTAEKIEHVIVTGDFHLSTQLVGADTSEFFPALKDAADGARIAGTWSKTARRLNDDFKVSVGFVNGKRCLGGMLELMMHCHYLVAADGTALGMPEVTLPVVPGMEGCHWPFRKAAPADWPKLVGLLLGGGSVKAGDAVGWLIDSAGPLDDALKVVWKIATDGDSGVARRKMADGALKGVPTEAAGLASSGDPATEAARKAIMDSVQASCSTTLAEALEVQTKHSAEFMTTPYCRKGRVGAEYARTVVE